MDFLPHLLPHSGDLTLNSWNFEPANYQVTFHIASTQTVAHCPLCNGPTSRTHSRYERRLKDLPWVQFALVLVLTVGSWPLLVILSWPG